MNLPRPTATAARNVHAAIPGAHRLLPAGGGVPVLLPDHLEMHGNLPYLKFAGRGALAGLLRDAGLATRDATRRPVHAELTALDGAQCLLTVTADRPKDTAMLWLVPHLVLDGIQLTSVALGTRRCRLELDQPNDRLLSLLQAELSVRAEACMDVTRVTMAKPVAAAGGRGQSQCELRLDAETLGHIALISRYGPRWFREAGTPERPGTELREIPLDDGRTDVVEVRHFIRILPEQRLTMNYSR
jgi:hypothetical protein